MEEGKTEIKRQVATILLNIQALLLRPADPFTWASGWRSPVYCDNRLVLAYPDERLAVIDAFVQLIQTQFQSAEAIAGVATAGIAHAALIASKLTLPMVYVRPAPKAHGTGKRIEGRLLKNQKVVVVEDLISTGKSSLQAIEALRNEGEADVLGLVSIFNYGFPQAAELFKMNDVPNFSLTDFDSIAQLALANGLISQQDWATIQQWQADPANWMQPANAQQG